MDTSPKGNYPPLDPNKPKENVLHLLRVAQTDPSITPCGRFAVSIAIGVVQERLQEIPGNTN